MKTFLTWLNEHPCEYMRIAILWVFASILSPWRIPMLMLLFVWHSLLLYLMREGE